jgi:hypothetical protein
MSPFSVIAIFAIIQVQIDLMTGCKKMPGPAVVTNIARTVSRESLDSIDTISTAVGRTADDISIDSMDAISTAVGRTVDDISISSMTSGASRGAISVLNSAATASLARVTPKLKRSVVYAFRASASSKIKSPSRPGKLKRKFVEVYHIDETASLMDTVPGVVDDKVLQDIILKQCLKRLGKVIGQEVVDTADEAATIARGVVDDVVEHALVNTADEAAAIARGVVDDVVEQALDETDDAFFSEMRRRINLLKYGDDAIETAEDATIEAAENAVIEAAEESLSLSQRIWNNVARSPLVTPMLASAKTTGGLLDENGNLLLRSASSTGIEDVTRKIIQETVDETRFWEALSKRLHTMKYGHHPTDDVIKKMVTDIMEHPEIFMERMTGGAGNTVARRIAFHETVKSMPEVVKNLRQEAVDMVNMLIKGSSNRQLIKTPGYMRRKWDRLRLWTTNFMRDARTAKGRELIKRAIAGRLKKFAVAKTDGRVDNRELPEEGILADKFNEMSFGNKTQNNESMDYLDGDSENRTLDGNSENGTLDYKPEISAGERKTFREVMKDKVMTSKCSLTIPGKKPCRPISNDSEETLDPNYVDGLIEYMETEGYDITKPEESTDRLFKTMFDNLIPKEEGRQYVEEYVGGNTYLVDGIVQDSLSIVQDDIRKNCPNTGGEQDGDDDCNEEVIGTIKIPMEATVTERADFTVQSLPCYYLASADVPDSNNPGCTTILPGPS